MLDDVASLARQLLGGFYHYVSEFKEDNYMPKGYELLKYEKFRGHACSSLELDYTNRLVYCFDKQQRIVYILNLIGHYKSAPRKSKPVQCELVRLYNRISRFYKDDELVSKYGLYGNRIFSIRTMPMTLPLIYKHKVSSKWML